MKRDVFVTYSKDLAKKYHFVEVYVEQMKADKGLAALMQDNTNR